MSIFIQLKSESTSKKVHSFLLIIMLKGALILFMYLTFFMP